MRRRAPVQDFGDVPVEFTECVVEEWADPDLPHRECTVVGQEWEPAAWRAQCLRVNAFMTWIVARHRWADTEGIDRHDLPDVSMSTVFCGEWPAVQARERWAHLLTDRVGGSWAGPAIPT